MGSFMRPHTITEKIEDYLAEMEGKISRKAHLIRIFLNSENYRVFKEELGNYWMYTTSPHSISTTREVYNFMGYLVEIVQAIEESIVIELRDEYKEIPHGKN